MDAPVQFYEYWYFHIPNYVLAALMYSLLARFLLSFVFAQESRNYIFRAFLRITDPVLALVRPITPHAVPPLLIVLLAALWVLIARFAFFASFAASGLAPTISS